MATICHISPESKAILDAMLFKVEQVVSPCYLVGGCVRDAVLNRPIHDFDITTPLHPDKVEEMVRKFGRKPYLAGKSYGTVGFKLDGSIVEVTTFRQESYPSTRRHPDVSFVTTLKDDLSRRDFTINAMAYNKTLFDPFDGLRDIQTQVIRSVGDPFTRMDEDPLRMLRAARFVAELGYTSDPLLVKAITKLRVRIFDIAKERWSQELTKLLLCDDPVPGLTLLSTTGLAELMFPEIVFASSVSQGLHTLGEYIGSKSHDACERWGAFFLALTAAHSGITSMTAQEGFQFASEMARRYGSYLKWSNAMIREVAALPNESAATEWNDLRAKFA